MRSRVTLASCFVLALAAASGAARGEELSQKVDPWVLDNASRGDTEFLVMLREQGDLRGARALKSKVERGAFVMDALRSTAEKSQRPLLDFLVERGAAHRSFWVANMIWVRGGKSLVEELASREDVFHIYANPRARFDGPVASSPAPDAFASPNAIEWGVMKVNAPQVWALGYTGQGVVVGGQDTGYDWNHPAIKGKYRGWNGSIGDHNYNWHDSVHSGGGGCGADSPEPCDDHSHGTHTMGTMVGSAGANEIGVAPGAKWIGCRNMDQGVGTPTSYSECFQWFIAPTNLAGQNPDPTKAPHVINNSWGCPPSEGCTDPTILQAVVESTRAAGIEVVVSAGNAGSGCGSVNDPPAIYDASFSVGATDISDDMASFSSRGPVTVDGSNRMKPDISAPGVNVRSSVPGGGYANFSGTSMAGPHVAGVVALVLSGNPVLLDDPDAIEAVLTASAASLTTTETCGGVPAGQIPNNIFGWGLADTLAAFNADLAIAQTDSPDPTVPGTSVTYTLTVTNLGPGPGLGVEASEGLTLSATVDSATPSQGSCTLLAHGVQCDLGDLASGASATISIVGTPTVAGTLTSNSQVTGSRNDPVSANDSAQVQTTVVNCPFPAPAITAPVYVPPATGGLAASADSGAGHTDTWTLTGGTIDSGQGTNQITFTSGAPGTTMLLEVVDSIVGCAAPAASTSISVDFLDVPPAHQFHDEVNTVARNGVTAGCGGGNYCPDTSVTRAQMAVFLLKALLGSTYEPPVVAQIFDDVPPGAFAYDFINDLSNRGITIGCGGGNYCPGFPVTRAQMAVFLLKTLLGSGYAPPVVAQIFDDVPPGAFAYDFINDLSNRGITIGCGGGNYCPGNPNTRGQMAVFLTLTFSLQ